MMELQRRNLSKILTSKTCLLLFALQLLSSINCTKHIVPECEPRLVLVDMGPRTDHFNKAVIWVHKCSGFSGSGKFQNCVATEWDDKIEHVSGLKSKREFKYTNHTKCEMKCSCSSAFNKCSNIDKENKRVNYLLECPEGSKWDFESCKCQATSKRVGCTKNDEETEMSVSITMFVVALVIEFIIVLIVIFLVMDACKYRQDAGVLHKTAEFVRSVSSGRREDHVTLKRDRNDTGSESFLNGYSTVCGKIDKV